MKSMYRKKMAEGGSVKTDKGYTKEQRSALKRLLEMIQPDAGDYVGEGVVETIKKPAVKKRGGGLARKGVGMALAKGGIVGRPARSYRDMKAGAGSGVGRMQKTKIQRGR